MHDQLKILLQNFDASQLEIFSGIAVRMAGIKAEGWTGQTTFVLNYHVGGVGDMQVNRGEIVRLQKKRK